MAALRTKTLIACLVLLCTSCGKSNGQWEVELGSPDPFVRGFAAIGLGLQAPAAASRAVPVLLQTIDRSDVGLEREAAQVLFMIGPFHIEALLQAMVNDPLMSFDSMGTIKNALSAAGPQACGPIVQCLSGPGQQLAGDLGDVLLGIGAPSLPALLELLEDGDDARMQNFSAFLIGKLGPQARVALPALQTASRSEDSGLREAALRSMAQIQGLGSRTEVNHEESR
jgi:HEAT repeat protein